MRHRYRVMGEGGENAKTHTPQKTGDAVEREI